MDDDQHRNATKKKKSKGKGQRAKIKNSVQSVRLFFLPFDL
jgi:hypothetical protein